MGRKEDMVKLAESLMGNRQKIRNIGIVAHIDHGKCISGKSRLMLSDGSFAKAERLFDRAWLAGKKVVEDNEKTVFAFEKPVKVFSLNKATGKIEEKGISHAWKLKGGKVLRVKLMNGFEISTTPEHKYLVFDGVNFKDVEARNLKEKDAIVSARNISIEITHNLKEEILKLLSKTELYAYLKSEFGKKIKEAIIGHGTTKIVNELQLSVKPSSLRIGLWKNNAIKLFHLLKICELFEVQNEKLYDEIERIGLKDSLHIKMPQKLDELYYLAGLFFGDGSNNKFVVGKPELEKKVNEICLNLGFEPYIRNYPNKTRELGTNNTLTAILNALFDYPLKKKSHNIKASEFLQKSPDFLVAEFLKGYFDTDGTVEKSRKAISISSASKQMILDVQLLLLRFGCTAIRNEKKSALYISGYSAKNFAEKISFGVKEKQQKAIEITENISGSTVTDTVPIDGFAEIRKEKSASMESISHHYYKYENKQYVPMRNTYRQIVAQLFKNKIIEKAKDIEDLAFIPIQSITEELEEFVYDFTVPETHNFLSEGIFIHNTTLTDNLIAAAGLISEELAGKQRFMDYYELEQERGITINAANISLVHDYKGTKHLINVIDTPGHIDFGGEVIRAMRAVDGVIVVVDAVEGVMPQTETVIRQALLESVRPVLFINKVDRLINELQLTAEQMQERFVKTITQVNLLIKKNAPEKFKAEWQVNVEKGSVSFGSAYNNWALSFSAMKTTGITFKDVFEFLKQDQQKELAKKAPLHHVLLEMVIKHLPDPIQAQKYRIPTIWKGELEEETAKSMLECNEKGALAMMVTDVSVDPHAGDIATGRIYSGTVKSGVKVRLLGLQKEVGIQQVALFMGPERVTVTEVPAGNIAALIGLKEVFAGETISTVEMKPFESFKSTAEPVMTISVEPKQPKDLPKLIEVIKQITKEDPNVVASLNQETGEHLLSGMGELHLDVTRYRIEVDHKVPIQVSQPIVVYHESMTRESPELEGKSPNKHNKFLMTAEPLKPEILEKLIESKIDGKVRAKDKDIVSRFDEMGFSRDIARKIWAVKNHCVFVDQTRGVIALHEIKEMVIQAFEDAMNQGPLAKEKCHGIMVSIIDTKLHEDAIHRGPAQVLPAVTRTIYACILAGNPILMEPKQLLTINVPESFMGAVTKELGQRRTQIRDIRTEGDTTIIIGKAPVKELIGFSASIRGATQGRAIWTAEYAGYEPLPRELQDSIVKEIRKRKGMDLEVKRPEFFLE